MAEDKSGMNSENTKGSKAERLRQDIDQTRANMDETIDELEKRMKPQHLLNDLVGMFSGGSADPERAKQAVSTSCDFAMRKLKAHPIPTALILAGTVWMLLEDESPKIGNSTTGRFRRNYYYDEANESIDPTVGGVYDEASSDYNGSYGTAAGASFAGEQGPGMLGRAKERISHVGESIRHARQNLSHGASDRMRRMREGVGHSRIVNNPITHRASMGYRAVRDRSGRIIGYTQERLNQNLETHPLMLGFAALIAGALVGAALPLTQREERVLREPSRQLGRTVAERARQASREMMERSRRVAQAAYEAGTHEAENQGLTKDGIAEVVKGSPNGQSGNGGASASSGSTATSGETTSST